LAAASGLGLLAAGARAQPMMGEAGAGGAGMRSGGRPGGPVDVEAMARHMERRISFLVWEIGGTPAQKDTLLAIAKAAMADLKPLREQHRAAREKGLALLAAAVIDKAALEQLRVSQMQAAEALSQRMLKSMVEAAEVLNPDQRVKLAERIRRRQAQRQDQHRRRP
jgi:Spy/CpxP family protein refolding chaperone